MQRHGCCLSRRHERRARQTRGPVQAVRDRLHTVVRRVGTAARPQNDRFSVSRCVRQRRGESPCDAEGPLGQGVRGQAANRLRGNRRIGHVDPSGRCHVQAAQTADRAVAFGGPGTACDLLKISFNVPKPQQLAPCDMSEWMMEVSFANSVTPSWPITSFSHFHCLIASLPHCLIAPLPQCRSARYLKSSGPNRRRTSDVIVCDGPRMRACSSRNSRPI